MTAVGWAAGRALTRRELSEAGLLRGGGGLRRFIPTPFSPPSDGGVLGPSGSPHTAAEGRLGHRHRRLLARERTARPRGPPGWAKGKGADSHRPCHSRSDLRIFQKKWARCPGGAAAKEVDREGVRHLRKDEV